MSYDKPEEYILENEDELTDKKILINIYKYLISMMGNSETFEVSLNVSTGML
jgi:hypothetical protein